LTFSVVICTRDREKELERCLDAVSRQKYPDFDVLVVDNAPHDAAAFEIARRWGVLYVMEPQAGLSRARNLGLRASTGEIIAFLDDDAVPDPNWLQNLAAEFKDPQVAAVAGRIKELRAPCAPRSEVGEFYALTTWAISGDRSTAGTHGGLNSRILAASAKALTWLSGARHCIRGPDSITVLAAGAESVEAKNTTRFSA